MKPISLTNASFDTQEDRKTIRDIEAVSVVVGITILDVGLVETMKDKIQTDTELRLRKAGIKVVSLEELGTIPGFPVLYINLNTMNLKSESRYVYDIYVGLGQKVSLNRNNFSSYCITWSARYLGITGSERLRKVYDSTGDLVDKFINVYLSVNNKGPSK